MAGNELKARRTNVPWVTGTYDDEKLLLALRSANPQQPLRDIQAAFNEKVPLERNRSLGAIGKRARALLKSKHQAEESCEPASCDVIAFEDTVMLLPFPCYFSSSNDYKSTISPSMTHMEIMSNSWDGYIDMEGYSTYVAMEWERLEVAKMVATEAASGSFHHQIMNMSGVRHS